MLWELFASASANVYAMSMSGDMTDLTDNVLEESQEQEAQDTQDTPLEPDIVMSEPLDYSPSHNVSHWSSFVGIALTIAGILLVVAAICAIIVCFYAKKQNVYNTVRRDQEDTLGRLPQLSSVYSSRSAYSSGFSNRSDDFKDFETVTHPHTQAQNAQKHNTQMHYQQSGLTSECQVQSIVL